MNTSLSQSIFERKVNQMAQAIENNRNVTINELFPFGSASQRRRYEWSTRTGKLAAEIRQALRYNPFKVGN